MAYEKLLVPDAQQRWHGVYGAYSPADAVSFIRALCGRAIDNAQLPQSVMPSGVWYCVECHAAQRRWAEATAEL